MRERLVAPAAAAPAALAALATLALAAFLTTVFAAGAERWLVAVAGAGLLAAALMSRPDLGVMAIFAVWFVELDPVGVRYLSLPYLVGALLILPLAVRVARDGGLRAARVPEIRLLAAIQLVFLVSTWWAEFSHPVVALAQLDDTTRMLLVTTSRLLVLVLLVSFVDTAARIERLAWLMIVLIGAAAASALWPLVTGDVMKRAKAAFSLADNANRLGFVCCFAFALVWFHRAYGPAGRLRTLATPLLVLFPITALAAGSRSALLQLLALGVILARDQRHWARAQRVQLVGLAAGLVLVAGAVVTGAQLGRATSFEASAAAPGGTSMQNRMERVRVAAEIVAANPVLGIGIGNFGWTHRSFYGQPPHSPHNSYLWALTAGGVGALALYLALFWRCARLLGQLEQAGPRDLLWLAKGLRAGVVIFLVFSASADFWISDFLYLIVGLTVAMGGEWARRAHAGVLA